MNNNSPALFKLLKIDSNFIILILCLNIVGLINLFSATSGSNISSVFWSQATWLSLGWLAFFLASLINADWLKKSAIPIYILHIGLLIGILLFGKIYMGAQRWFDLGFFKFQPSETAKTSVILILSYILSRRSSFGHQPNLNLKKLIFPVIILVIPFLLILKQPDLGTALIILAIGGSLLLFVGIQKKILLFACIAGLVTAPIMWNFVLKDYQKRRVMTFLSPDSDPRGAGYNSIQSKIAVGSGEFLGKGFMQGTQSQLEFLPERHTDFIFSVLSEEHGFLGAVTTVGLFFILFILSIRIATQARDLFSALLCIGLTASLFWHFFINVGMVMGLLPVVGVPLPLVSYGGSSLVSNMASLGLIAGVSIRKNLF